MQVASTNDPCATEFFSSMALGLVWAWWAVNWVHAFIPPLAVLLMGVVNQNKRLRHMECNAYQDLGR